MVQNSTNIHIIPIQGVNVMNKFLTREIIDAKGVPLSW